MRKDGKKRSDREKGAMVGVAGGEKRMNGSGKGERQ